MGERLAGILLWLDDLRDPARLPWSSIVESLSMYDVAPVGLHWARSYDEFCDALDRYGPQICAVSFDNDLGAGREGRHALTELERRIRLHDWPRITLHAHTANPAARAEMVRGFEVIRAYWAER